MIIMNSSKILTFSYYISCEVIQHEEVEKLFLQNCQNVSRGLVLLKSVALQFLHKSIITFIAVPFFKTRNKTEQK